MRAGIPHAGIDEYPSESLELDCLPVNGEQVSPIVKWSDSEDEATALLPRTSAPSKHRRLPPLFILQPTVTKYWIVLEQYRDSLQETMEKIRKNSVVQTVDRLAVSSEPGLTNAQLMLTNHDLKPGMATSVHNAQE